jgi:dethiobiotin synthetase
MPDHEKYPRLIVEGAGGVMVPLNENQFMVDLMKYLDLPVLVVARGTLGTINHTLVTLEILRQNGLEILGVVLNGPPNSINRNAIKTYGHVRVMAEVDVLPQLNFQTVSKAYHQYFR